MAARARDRLVARQLLVVEQNPPKRCPCIRDEICVVKLADIGGYWLVRIVRQTIEINLARKRRVDRRVRLLNRQLSFAGARGDHYARNYGGEVLHGVQP